MGLGPTSLTNGVKSKLSAAWIVLYFMRMESTYDVVPNPPMYWNVPLYTGVGLQGSLEENKYSYR